MILSRVVYFSLVLFISACSNVPMVKQEPASHNPAVMDLYTAAAEFTGQGRYDQAKSSLERALRFEPKNAWLWYELAIINQLQGNYRDAQNLALRARSFTSSPKLITNIDMFLKELEARSYY